jgi:hypothetical protein
MCVVQSYARAALRRHDDRPWRETPSLAEVPYPSFGGRSERDRRGGRVSSLNSRQKSPPGCLTKADPGPGTMEKGWRPRSGLPLLQKPAALEAVHLLMSSITSPLQQRARKRPRSPARRLDDRGRRAGGRSLESVEITGNAPGSRASGAEKDAARDGRGRRDRSRRGDRGRRAWQPAGNTHSHASAAESPGGCAT